MRSNETGMAVNLTATGDVFAKGCVLLGFFVNSTTDGTVVMRRGGSGGVVLNGAITPPAGRYYKFPADCPGGLHHTEGGTALDITYFIQPYGQ
jgi:hypothetical protein